MLKGSVYCWHNRWSSAVVQAGRQSSLLRFGAAILCVRNRTNVGRGREKPSESVVPIIHTGDGGTKLAVYLLLL